MRIYPRRPPALSERVAALHLADVILSDQEDVIDPAGGEEATYAACVAELWVLCQQLIRPFIGTYSDLYERIG